MRVEGGDALMEVDFQPRLSEPLGSQPINLKNAVDFASQSDKANPDAGLRRFS